MHPSIHELSHETVVVVVVVVVVAVSKVVVVVGNGPFTQILVPENKYLEECWEN